jgi:hypothetical protein
MTSDQILMRLRDDFPFYASRCLRIRAKVAVAGQKIIPFVLNRAQMYLHQRLEDQKRRTGRVRALVLKGRQQGCCLDPNTPVLTADLKWVKIKDLRVGQKLVACDEKTGVGTGTGARRMRTSEVVKKWKSRRPAFRVTFHDGRSVVCSAEHRWLSRKSQKDPKWRSLGGSGKSTDGREALKVGDYVRSITKFWGEPGLEDYWFGGMLDGEGSLDYARRTGVDLSVSQRAGAVLDRMLEHCNSREYPFCVVADGPRKTKYGQQPVYAISISNMSEMFRLLGLSRPSRFIGIEWWNNKRMPDNGWLRIESIEPLGEMDLVDIETTTQTYIANGLVSHNSTYIGGRYFHKTTFNPGMKTFILAHRDDATDNLFKQVKRFYENLPRVVQPSTSYSNRKELIFDKLDSAYGLGTAGSGSVGRSDTIDLLHGSEAAFWANVDELRTGVLQAAEMAQEIIFESTANGYDPMFFPMWQDAEAGKGQYEAIFIPWYWQDEYRSPVPAGFVLDEEEAEYAEAYGLDLGQMAWRRNKIIELKDPLLFKQEYPATAAEAFQVTGTESFISSRDVAAARRNKNIRPIGAHIVGVDPAREGEDRAVYIHRRGRVAWGLKKENSSNSMHIVGRIKGILDAKDDPVDMVFIDRGGEGGAIYDRLCEMGYEERITLVNFGSRKTVLEPDKYFNKRAEMWGLMKEWLQDPNGVEIPDLDSLQADLTAPSYKYDSEQRVILEKKEEIKKRGLRSPDEADALALTFAFPVKPQEPMRSRAQTDYDVLNYGTQAARMDYDVLGA